MDKWKISFHTLSVKAKPTSVLSEYRSFCHCKICASMGSGCSWKQCSRAQLCASVSSLSSDSTCWRPYSLSTACNKCCRLPLHPLCETLIQYPTVGHDCSRQHCCTGHSHAKLTPVYYLNPLMLMLRIWEGSSDTLWSLTEAQRKFIIREYVPWVAILALTELTYNECDIFTVILMSVWQCSAHIHYTALPDFPSISPYHWKHDGRTWSVQLQLLFSFPSFPCYYYW